MRSTTQSFGVHESGLGLHPQEAPSRFDRLAARLRRAGLVWAQAEPGCMQWSRAGDERSRLVADSPWIRRQVTAAAHRWAHGEPVEPEQALPGCWLLPAGTRRRCDGMARGIAVALTQHATGADGNLRALCQGAGLDFQLTAERLQSEPSIRMAELPRLASMVRLIRPASLRVANPSGVEALLQAVDATRPTVRGHSERASRLAVRLATEAGWSPAERETARVAGLLHDVGKILVPAEALRKEGPLSATETSAVRRHAVFGGMILRKIPVLAFAAPVARWHHERWDGLGYPDGIHGAAIPLHARVVAVADALDAMVSVRPYRRAMTLTPAFTELEAESGAQFDPLVVSAIGPLVGAPGFEATVAELAHDIEVLPTAA